MINASKRRPYTPPMTGGWWRHLGFYRFYMLREATAIPAIWFSLELLGDAVMLNGGEADWTRFVAFLQHPLVLVVTLLLPLGLYPGAAWKYFCQGVLFPRHAPWVFLFVWSYLTLLPWGLFLFC
ncbi:MAG: hypothetical protein ACMX3H_15340 [Sodalis sp. (in: enterobacteria)]|uniref:hypothetical protein n=1 Tax=Sodalis sp. (in: enterobacteria) TaxID=1898979 RepID=UPI0039E4DDE3